jgi:hypothetical protein
VPVLDHRRRSTQPHTLPISKSPSYDILLFWFYVVTNDQKQVFKNVGGKLSNHDSEESESRYWVSERERGRNINHHFGNITLYSIAGLPV